MLDAVEPSKNACWLVNVIGHELGLKTFIQDLTMDGNFFDLIAPGMLACMCMLLGTMSHMWQDLAMRAVLERLHLKGKKFRLVKRPQRERDFGINIIFRVRDINFYV